MAWDLLYLVGAPVVRGILGWAENALQDGKIETFELMKLGETVLRVGTLGLAGAYGLQIDAAQAGGLAVAVDFLLSKYLSHK